MKTNSLAECLCQYPTKGSLAPMTELLIKIYTNIKIEHLSTLSVMLQTLSESFLYWQRICCTLSFFLHVDGCFYCGTVPPFTASPPSQKTSSKNQKKILCTWGKQRGIRAGHERSKSHTLHTAVLILFWYTFKMGPKMRHSIVQWKFCWNRDILRIAMESRALYQESGI